MLNALTDVTYLRHGCTAASIGIATASTFCEQIAVIACRANRQRVCLQGTNIIAGTDIAATQTFAPVRALEY